MSNRKRCRICLAVLGVQDLGMKLDPGEPAGDVLERGHRRAGRATRHYEAVRGSGDFITVTHPHLLLRR